jgi:hypothetical protein
MSWYWSKFDNYTALFYILDEDSKPVVRIPNFLFVGILSFVVYSVSVSIIASSESFFAINLLNCS